jgi:hypothetical protein
VLSIYGADNIRKIPSFLKLINCVKKTCHRPELISGSMKACSGEHHEFDPLFVLLCNDPSEMREEENGTTVLSKNSWKHKHFHLLNIIF